MQFGQELFGLYLRNKTFPKYRVCVGIQQIIHVFIMEQNQQKLKLVSTIFYQIFIFHQMIALQKL